MIEVVVVRVEYTKNIYYLSPNSLSLKKGEKVVIETENGLLIGNVIQENYEENKKNLLLPLEKVVRIATEKDQEQLKNNENEASEALNDAKRYSKDLMLDMNFVDSFYNLDRSQLIFSFVAENRVDFRDLAKKLAQKYKTRIELRQIGVRDKSKRIGGLGPCGLFLCCNFFLTDFNSVSINMAKNQLLALNPSKINGVCGRLLCCLGYENETYSKLKKNLPKIGTIVDTPEGKGKVVALDVLKESYQVEIENKGIINISKEEKNGSLA